MGTLTRGRTVPVQLVVDMSELDPAVLKISANDRLLIVVANSSQIQVGRSPFALGSPSA